MTNKSWRCCIKDPPELGKKVLCNDSGDIFVGQRFDDYYIPMPFADHPLAKGICKPKTWQEIDFPDGLKGYVKVAPNGDLAYQLTMDQLKERHPEMYREFADAIINSIGSQHSWDNLNKSPSAES